MCVVAERAVIARFVIVVAAHAGEHGDRFLHGEDVAAGDIAVTGDALGLGLADMQLVREVYVVLELINTLPLDGLIRLLRLGDFADVRAIGFDGDVTGHALRLLGEAGEVSRRFDGVAILAF